MSVGLCDIGVVPESQAVLFVFDLQRKETLLKEYKLKNKSSKFIDKRLGEYDNKIAPEDKILQRFAMERQVSCVMMHNRHQVLT